MITLTERQRQLLTILSNGGDLIVDGLEVWCEDERTSYTTFDFFVKHILISSDDGNPDGAYWHINEAGRKLLAGERAIYCLADGRYAEDWREALEAAPSAGGDAGGESERNEHR